MEQLTRNFGQKYIAKVNAIQITKLNKFGKTNSRSILGSMNDFKLNAKFRVINNGFNTEIYNSINYYTNQMPMGALKYKTPFEMHKNLIIATK